MSPSRLALIPMFTSSVSSGKSPPPRRCCSGCSYGRFLERFYWLVLLLTFVVAAACIAVAFTVKDFPSLDDPTVVLYFFLKKLLQDISFFVGPPIHLFGTSGDVSPSTTLHYFIIVNHKNHWKSRTQEVPGSIPTGCNLLC